MECIDHDSLAIVLEPGHALAVEPARPVVDVERVLDVPTAPFAKSRKVPPATQSTGQHARQRHKAHRPATQSAQACDATRAQRHTAGATKRRGRRPSQAHGTRSAQARDPKHTDQGPKAHRPATPSTQPSDAKHTGQRHKARRPATQSAQACDARRTGQRNQAHRPATPSTGAEGPPGTRNSERTGHGPKAHSPGTQSTQARDPKRTVHGPKQ